MNPKAEEIRNQQRRISVQELPQGLSGEFVGSRVGKKRERARSGRRRQ